MEDSGGPWMPPYTEETLTKCWRLYDWLLGNATLYLFL
jgi:hypothetical protein